MAARIGRALNNRGLKVVRNAVSFAAQHATTGYRARSYGADQTITAFVGSPRSRTVATDVGDITKVQRSFNTQTAVVKGDKITLNDGTYYISEDVLQITRRQGGGATILYQTVVERDPFG